MGCSWCSTCGCAASFNLSNLCSPPDYICRRAMMSIVQYLHRLYACTTTVGAAAVRRLGPRPHPLLQGGLTQDWVRSTRRVLREWLLTPDWVLPGEITCTANYIAHTVCTPCTRTMHTHKAHTTGDPLCCVRARTLDLLHGALHHSQYNGQPKLRPLPSKRRRRS